VAGLVDRMVMRTVDGLPYIPGSTVKGRWRFTAERLLRTNGSNPSFKGQGLFCHGENQPECSLGEGPCTICRLFGCSTRPGIVWVGQAELEECLRGLIQELLARNPNPVVHPDTELRPGIALSRHLRTALGDHLFFDEVLPARLSLAGEVMINDALAPTEEGFLRASAALTDRLGGRKAVGRGALRGGIVLSAPGGGS
jgi:CRISPR/Cas system CSM-associated protein Csm3 (group 7 of RAMP superfamily)